MKYNYKIILSYDGGRFEGWQKQQGRLTIQETVEECISNICCEKVKVIASGRTDAGVHALGQTANFHTDCRQEEEKFLLRCNEMLPEDVRILSCEAVEETFHSRYDAVEKTYCYTIDMRERPSVFTRRYAYSVPERLDIQKMKKAAEQLVGTHDFRSFTSDKRKDKKTVRNLKDIQLVKDNIYLKMYFTGEGFLYHMVRILAGTLIEIGMGKKTVEEIPEIFQAKNRFRAGFMAPAHGLMLLAVNYVSDGQKTAAYMFSGEIFKNKN